MQARRALSSIIRSRRAVATGIGGLLTSCCLTGCVGTVELQSDYVGIEALSQQQSSATSARSAADLPTLSDLDESARPAYRIGPLDEINVTVWGRADLGSQTPMSSGGELKTSSVRADGSIFLPFLDSVQVADRTLIEIQKILTDRYAEVIEAPQVIVTLVSCRSRRVEISGEVEQPGSYTLCDNLLTVGELTGAAGGPTASAGTSGAVLVRGGEVFALDYSAARRGQSRSAEVLLEERDSIHFPSLGEQFVYVFGEVRGQGVVQIPPDGLTILEALAEVGGPMMRTAKKREVYLAKVSPNDVTIFELQIADLISNPDIYLAHGDRLFIPPTDLERWSRWWSQAIPGNTINTRSVERAVE